jgi:hypothetical protein
MIHTALNWWEYSDPEIKIRFPYVQANLYGQNMLSPLKYLFPHQPLSTGWHFFVQFTTSIVKIMHSCNQREHNRK